uniref:Uncharacterized protein n=1 Tax=Neobodo designis TaxID=312471 RepID=A0A7S1QIW6_NEODS
MSRRRVTYEEAQPQPKSRKPVPSPRVPSLTTDEAERLTRALRSSTAETPPRASLPVVCGILLKAGISYVPPMPLMRRIIDAAVKEHAPHASVDCPPVLSEGLLLRISSLLKLVYERRSSAARAISADEREEIEALHSLTTDAGSGPVVPLDLLRDLQANVGVVVSDVIDVFVDKHASAAELERSTTRADFDAACADSQSDRVIGLQSLPLDGLIDAIALRQEAENEQSGHFGADPDFDTRAPSPFASLGRVRSQSPLLSETEEMSAGLEPSFADPVDTDAGDTDEMAFLRTVKSLAKTSRTVATRRESLHASAFGSLGDCKDGQRTTAELHQRLDEIVDDATVANDANREQTDGYCLGQLHLHRLTAASRLRKATARRRFTLAASSSPPRADIGSMSRSARSGFDELVESTPVPKVPADRSIVTEHGVLPAQVTVGSRVLPASLQHFHLEHSSRAQSARACSRTRGASRASASRAPSVLLPSPRTQASVRRHVLNVSAGRAQAAAHFAPSPPATMRPVSPPARAHPGASPQASPQPRAPATPFAKVALFPTSRSPAATCVRRFWQETLMSDAPSRTHSSARSPNLVLSST